jgi:hypothetical protein
MPWFLCVRVCFVISVGARFDFRLTFQRGPICVVQLCEEVKSEAFACVCVRLCASSASYSGRFGARRLAALYIFCL